MQHAAEISSGDFSDSKIERAMRQRDYFLQQTTAGRSISNTLKAGYQCGVTAANALRPENVSKSFKAAATKFHSMTWTDLFIELLKQGWKAGRAIFFVIFFLVATIFRFVGNLMDDHLAEGDLLSQQKQTPQKQKHGFPASGFPTGYAQQVFPEYNRRTAAHDVDAFGINIHHVRNESPPEATDNKPTSGYWQ